MARSAKKTAVSPQPQAPEIERPPQPQRYKASKEELLQFYVRCCSSAASRSARGSSTASA